MVDELVYEVRSNSSRKRISSLNSNAIKNSSKIHSKKIIKKQVIGKTCPKCKKGTLLKGTNAYGCSEYKNNCNFKILFKVYGKKISENQVIRLLEKGCTANLKGFTTTSGKVNGLIRFDDNFNLQLERKEVSSTATKINDDTSDKIFCPKCKKGTVLKGKKAYGCSDYKNGCDFVYTFQNIKKIANGKPLTKELVLKIIAN